MEDAIENILAGWRGSHEQIPPMYSAKKQAGTRLYKLARQGEDVPRMPVRVEIHALELAPENGTVLQRHNDGTSDFSMRVRCSAGTYIRSLAHEIGQQLGCGGHIISLRRTAAGPFRIDQAVPLDEFEQQARTGQAIEHMIPFSHIPLPFPTIRLSPIEADKLRHGQSVRRAEATEDSYCKLVDAGGDLIAIGHMAEGERLIQPRVVFC
jgi:tRNA pseudouridine55 synthase